MQVDDVFVHALVAAPDSLVIELARPTPQNGVLKMDAPTGAP